MDLFQKACELASDRRAAFLDETCGHDAELRRDVEGLLGCDEISKDKTVPIAVGEGARFLAAEVARNDPGMADAAEADDSLPERLGPYQVVRKLGEGGMGVVYLGVQESPQRMVALKALKPGIASAETLRRFEHEAQILGWLQHPGIAQIYEANMDTADKGARPFISMEYIQGKPLTDYVNSFTDPPFSFRDRLKLFVKICDAVAYAHQQVIIHRDLKPSNILIDESGQPKVLDFGVARLLDAKQQAITLHTSAGEVIGTLAYMSPEQAAGENREVDIRSDVYALGVVLYEMLTGRLPHALANHSLFDAARVIRDEEPPPLSSINKACRGDVDTIVRKALAKEKSRRYQSAAELGADIERYLIGEPIAARRDSNWYVLSKTLKRYKFAVSVTAAFLLLISASAVALAFMYREQSHARDRAEAQAVIAREERDSAETARDAELQARREAEAINDFLRSMLSSVNPDETMNPDIRVRDVLDTSSKLVADEFTEHPKIAAALHQTIGGTYSSLGLYEEAESHLKKALRIRKQIHGDEHVVVAQSLIHLGLVLQSKGRYVEAVTLHQEALATQRRLLNDEHPQIASTLNNLGTLLSDTDDIAGAEEYFSEALAIARKTNSDDLSTYLSNLAHLLQGKGDYAGAEGLYREALADHRRRFGDHHPSSIYIQGNLAVLLQDQGQYEEAELQFRNILERQRQRFVTPHPDLARSISNLAGVLAFKREFGAAELLFREVLVMQRELAGAKRHPNVALALHNLGVTLCQKGEYKEAERLLREALVLRREMLGDDHGDTASTMHNFASVLVKMRQVGEETERMFRKALTVHRKLLGESHPMIAKCLEGLAELFMVRGELEQAASLLRQALQINRRMLPAEHPLVVLNLNNLAVVLRNLGDYGAAEPPAREALEIRRKILPESHPDIAKSLILLGRILLKRADAASLAEAEMVFRECVEIRQLSFPKGHYRIADAQSRLGECLVALRRYEDAEPFLLAAYEVLQDNPKVSGERKRQILQELKIASSETDAGFEAPATGNTDGEHSIVGRE